MNHKKILILVYMICLFVIIFTTPVFSQEGHIKLLAVQDINENETKGSVADLYLDIEEGKGRVFLETYPLAKLDTQISTRVAKEIACNYIDIDCEKYDFFYTLRADSSIVGGPSAGGAIAVLTASMLKGWELDSNTAITGTINSGGLIGPVGGLEEKIEAASEEKISKVLISRGSRFSKKDNMTFDLESYGEDLNVSVSEIVDLDDAIYYFTGNRIKDKTKDIKISEDYKKTMKTLAQDLCQRAKSLKNDTDNVVYDENLTRTKERSDNLTQKGLDEISNESYYSKASYCFGANVGYRELIFIQENYNDFNKVLEWINTMENATEAFQIKTISDLQAYMIVKERLKDSKKSLEEAEEKYQNDEDYFSQFAYSYERAYSAKSWMTFFRLKGKEYEFNDEMLKKSCINKISEAEERLQYANIYFPTSLIGIREKISEAKLELEENNNALCLFHATEAKAEADSVITIIGVSEEDAPNVLDNRLEVSKRIIAEQKQGVFPILGYSYYEYSKSLRNDDLFSSLLYSQYALEMSNLQIYFKEKKEENIFDNININYPMLLLFLSGVLIGFSFGYWLRKRHSKNKKNLKKSK